MIVRISHEQPELRVPVNVSGYNLCELIRMQRLRMVIQAPPCGCILKSPIIITGCWPGCYDNLPRIPQELLHERPMLVYPAFDISDCGDVVFRFDEQLWNMPRGRYYGIIELDGRELTRLDLDLGTAAYIGQATTFGRGC